MAETGPATERKAWPDWTLDYHMTRIGRHRVVCGLRFDADAFRRQAEQFHPDLETFRDVKGSWCVAPKETD